jgi:acyl carrier protein
MTTSSTSAATSEVNLALEGELAQLIITALSLETTAEEVAPDAPLFGAGLGLDSIDALELALAISKAYGVQLRSDDEGNHRIFASLRSLAAHIAQHRTR